MNESESKIVTDDGQQEDLQATLRKTMQIVHSQQELLTAHQQAIVVLGDKLIEAHADVKITKIAVSVLLRELAGHDPAKLDRLIARSVARAEIETKDLNAPVRGVILSSIDELIALTEGAG